MNDRNKKLIKFGVFILLLLWLGFFMAQKIDLTTADLGRHLQNGRWVAENHFNIFQKNSPVHENFYSYTNADFPVVNHHWGSGVLFYIIYKIAGFLGLSFFYIVFSLAVFAIFFRMAWKNSDFTTAVLISLLLTPLMAERTEIRPEVFSYFFAAVFFWILWGWQRRESAKSRLYILPILMIFWVNFHVYFFVGLFLIGVFWLSEVVQLIFSKLNDRDFSEKISRIKKLTIIIFFSTLASLLSPFGLKGLIYPLQIFKNYGYTIVENKSVWFVENYGIVSPNFFLIKITLSFLILSFILVWLADRKKFSFIHFLTALFFGILGCLAIRNFTIFGFFALPILAQNISGTFSLQEKERSIAKENGIAATYIIICIFAAFSSYQFLTLHSQKQGLGTFADNEKSVRFFNQESIRGPIFNNYDIGGYLIFGLPSRQKVFVDNRPEAYPDSFFSEVYKPMQENPDIFKKIDEQYNFNAVFFCRNDITPWGMNFLKKIKENSDWAKVFEDDYAVVYLKRNKVNNEIIDKHKM